MSLDTTALVAVVFVGGYCIATAGLTLFCVWANRRQP